jgi:hypothetical protein
MRKRLILATVALSVAVYIVLTVLALQPPRHGLTKANFDRVEDGMSLLDVETIFGGMPRYGNQSPQGQLYFTWVWQGDDGAGAIITVFGNKGVTHKQWIPPSEETFLDKIRRWLRL